MNKPGMKDEEKAQARTGYIHICMIGIEGNQIELTV